MLRPYGSNGFNPYRKPLQWAVMALIAVALGRWWLQADYTPDFEAVCPLGGMQALSGFMVTNSLACSMTALQIAMGIALGVGVLLAGKLFCGMLCPLGTLTEWLGRIGERLHLRWSPRGITDRLLRLPKYALLFATFYITIGASELFCRTYDPFYAALTGFSGDVSMLYAIPAIIILIAGSVFVRQAWCRYFCPLGAATNIFVWALPVLAVAGLWMAFNAILAPLSWMWLLGGICATGFILEAVTLRGFILPGMKVRRVESVCTGCRKCDRVCPMAIDISQAGAVRHIDCHLCTDCVQVCPEKGALVIARSSVPWLPAAVVLVLTAGGLFLGATMNIPTISQRWGDPSALARAQVLEQSGMKSVKCFGSSSSFASRMRQVPGVLGVETYVGTHTVKVWYDPRATDAAQVRASMYTPSRLTISEPAADARVVVLECSIDRLFDPVDHFALEEMLIQHGHIYAVETRFGEPVHAMIYFDPAGTTAERIAAAIERPDVTWETEKGRRTEQTAFRVRILSRQEIGTAGMRTRMFAPYDATFNAWDVHDPARLARLDIPLAGLDTLRASLPYLVSHLSDDTAIVRLESICPAEGPRLRIWYAPSGTTPASIRARLMQDSLSVMFEDGKLGRVGNTFSKALRK